MSITADAITLVDRSSMRVIDCNDAACRMFGYSRGELLDLTPADICGKPLSELEVIYDEIIKGEIYPITESIFQRKDGLKFPVEIMRQAIPFFDDWVMALRARDISDRKETESRLIRLANYDQLTGLPNRGMFFDTLKKALLQAKKQSLTISVLLINIIQFKDVNNIYGLSVGDELLRQVGDRLLQGLRIRDIVGRLGDDDFGLILFNSEHSQGTSIVAKKVLQMIRKPFDLYGRNVEITASIGVAMYPHDTDDANKMITYGATAMREARQVGEAFRFHTAEMNAKMLEKHFLQEALSKALDNDEFILHYQPKKDIKTGEWMGVEALLRWNRGGHGLVSPAIFIPSLEETGMIVPVGDWVIKSACRQILEWGQLGLGDIKIAINISAKQFLDENLALSINAALQEYGVSPNLLEIEITETSLMSDSKKTISILRELKAIGINISIDDFGTGYSNLSYLKLFPIDQLKIDITFIRDVTTNDSDAAIVTAIINMAHSLNLTVVAEGVETKEQLEFLRKRNCDKFQGYYFSRPLPAHELCKLRQ